MNALDQIHDRGMIGKKMLGFHTHMYNSNEAPSEMRLGGYNEELFKKGHEQVWLNTTDTMSWEVKFNSVDFHRENVYNDMHALIDPGYPFIGMPFHEFETFKEVLADKFPDHPIDCETEDWCHFGVPCDDIRKDMPDLKFSFPIEHHLLSTAVYTVRSDSFLFKNIEEDTESETCHLMIVPQKFSEFDHFILGQVFMENFYVTYDATNPDQLRVGISQLLVVPEGKETMSVGAEVTLITIAVLLGFFIAIIGIWICVRHSRQSRLAKAKAYFASL